MNVNRVIMNINYVKWRHEAMRAKRSLVSSLCLFHCLLSVRVCSFPAKMNPQVIFFYSTKIP